MVQSKPLVLFGCGGFSTLAANYLKQDAGRTVAAFTVDARFKQAEFYEGCPLIAFDELVNSHPPCTYDIAVPIGNTRINGLRKERFEQAKAMGYSVVSYVSSRATISSDTPVGENVFIFEQVVIQAFATIGENIFLRSGANIGHHTKVGDHTFIASGVVTGGNVTIGERCWIGLGAILRDGITIGDRCFIGMGAVVTADTEPDGVYAGIPARRIEGKTSLDVTSAGI